MMKTKVILVGILACMTLSLHAKEDKNQEPKGRAIVQAFANFHSGFGAQNDDRGFELDRSYFGYEYNFGKGLSAKAVMDIGMSDDVSDYHRIAYIKNAMVTWKRGRFVLNGGLISTNQFNFQEKFWGYRYVLKSFQDQYKFGSSADLGLSASFKFTQWISADAIIVNGEGYKKFQKNDGLNYGVGVTLTPVKGFQMRIYGGWNECGEKGKSNILNFASFAGYKNEKFSIGAEYNLILNSSYTEGNDQCGYSLFVSAKVSKVTDFYFRFDDLYSKNGWNISKEEQAAIAGAQFKIGKYVKLAPNFRVKAPKVEGAKARYSAYINGYFGF